MNKIFKLLVLLSIVTVSTNSSAGKVEKIANKNLSNWNYALKSGHVDAIMRFYAQNAMLVQSNGNIYGDSDSIRDFWKKIFTVPGAYEFNLTEAHRDGDSIVMTAKLASVETKPGNQFLDTMYNGTIQHVLQEQGNGNWKTVVQQWN